MTGYVDGTLQWSLELKCAMRAGENWGNPYSTRELLTLYRSYAQANHEEIVSPYFVFEGRFASSVKLGEEYIPSSGFHINQTFAIFGGFEGVIETCKLCKGNVYQSMSNSLEITGCEGWLRIGSYDKSNQEIDEEFSSILKKKNLEQQYKKLFPHSEYVKYIWYALWIDSPLSSEQCIFLVQMLENFLHKNRKSPVFFEEAELRGFLLALQTSIDSNLSLHVDYMPISHMTMGTSWSAGCIKCHGWDFKEVVKGTLICNICGKQSQHGINAGGFKVTQKKLYRILQKI